MRFPELSKREVKSLLSNYRDRRWLENFLLLKNFSETFGRLPKQK